MCSDNDGFGSTVCIILAVSMEVWYRIPHLLFFYLFSEYRVEQQISSAEYRQLP